MSFSTFQLLKSVGLSDTCAIRLLPAVRSQTFEADQVIWSKGDKRQPFTYIAEGLVVCASDHGGDGTPNPVNIFNSGTWFGEAGFLNQPSGFNYLCLGQTRLVSIPYDHALFAFEQEAEFSRFIARMTHWRDQQHAEMLALMRTGSPALCVVMGLAMLAAAILNNSSHLPNNQLDAHLEIPLKQSLLASICGVSRGTFSACLQQLVAAGWLQVNYATIKLQSLQTWHGFASMQRQNQHRVSKLSMAEILGLMHTASGAGHPAVSHSNPPTHSASGARP